MEPAAKGHTVMLRIWSATILAALSAGAQIAVPATPSGGNSFLAASVREWTYELQMHGPGGVHFDPYFVNSVLLETNLSHGARRDSGDGKAVKLTLRASPTGEKGERPLELDDAARKAFFGPTITKASLVVVSSVDPLAENHPWKFKGQDKDGAYKELLPFPQPLLALEIRGTMDMKNKDPWVLSELLAFVPMDGKTTIDHLGWSSSLLSESVQVPAGTFKRVFVSRRPRGNGRSIQRHTLESWVAEGVGLIKAQAVNQAGAPIYSLQLVAYQ